MPRDRTSKKHKCLSASCRVNNQGSVNQSYSLTSTSSVSWGWTARQTVSPRSCDLLPGLPRPQLLRFSNKEYMCTDELALGL